LLFLHDKMLALLLYKKLFWSDLKEQALFELERDALEELEKEQEAEFVDLFLIKPLIKNFNFFFFLGYKKKERKFKKKCFFFCL
jgi:uncharacterized protein YaaW (UPF0174 family)